MRRARRKSGGGLRGVSVTLLAIVVLWTGAGALRPCGGDAACACVLTFGRGMIDGQEQTDGERTGDDGLRVRYKIQS